MGKIRFRSLKLAVVFGFIGSTLSLLFMNAASPAGITGNIDGFTVIGGQPHVVGWACDYGQNRSINVHMYIGGGAGVGTYAGAYRAVAATENAVNTACGTSGIFHRFYIPMTKDLIAKHAGKRIHIHGISLTGKPNYQIQKSGTFAVPVKTDHVIDGYIDEIMFSHAKSQTAGTIDRIIRGWACDVNTANPVTVHVYVGAPAGRTGATYLKSAKANIDAGATSGIATRCGFNSGVHRFEILLTEAEVNAHAGKALYIHGISQNPTGRNGLIIRSGQFTLPQKRVTVSKVEDIQRALDAAYDGGGGVVAVRNGTYYLKGHLNIRSNTALISDSKVRYVRDSRANLLRNQLNTAKNYSGYGNIAIIGGTWDGNSMHYPESHASFALGYADNLIVRGVTILDVTGGGHAIDLASSRDVLIEDSKFLGLVMSGASGENIKEAIQLDHNIPPSAYTVASFAFGTRDGSTNYNVTIRNNVFGANPNSDNPNSAPWPVGVGGHGAVHDKYQNKVLIENNTFNGNTYAGVRVMKWNNVVVRNNKFNNCQIALRTTAGSWSSSSAMNPERTVSYGVSQAGTNLSFTGNLINGAAGVALAIYGAAGDEAENVPAVPWKKVTVSRNTFKNVSSHGATFDKVESFSFTNNTISLLENAAFGIRVYNSKSGTITGNKIYGGKSSGVYLGGGNTKVTATSNTWQK